MNLEEEIIRDILDSLTRAQAQVLLVSQLREAHSQAGAQFLYQLLRHDAAVLATTCERTVHLLDSVLTKALPNRTEETTQPHSTRNPTGRQERQEQDSRSRGQKLGA